MTDSTHELEERVRALRADFEAALAAAADGSALQVVQDRFLGRRAGQGTPPSIARTDPVVKLDALEAK